MATAVLSDLHLGSRSSILGTPAVRERLFERLAGADEVVLLGDVMSLRAAPVRDVAAAARPFLEGLGEVMAGRRVVVVPGNHDHRLADPLVDGDAEDAAVPLGLERLASAGGWLARLLDPAEVVLAYPGLWIRPDVYATHGHYLDCHLTVPRLESLLAAGIQGFVGMLDDERLAPEDYEAVLAPIYAFAYRRAQAGVVAGRRAPLRSLARRLWAAAWRSMAPGGGLRRLPGRAATGAVGLAAIAAINRAGVGPFSADLTPAEVDRAGTRAMAEVVGRLGIEAEHVVFGHTHRAGPLYGEDWPPGLVNPGGWIHEPMLVGEARERSPYWPGRWVLVHGTGPPELSSLLEEPAPAVPAVT